MTVDAEQRELRFERFSLRICNCFDSLSSLPEGLYYVGGGCGSSIQIWLPGEGDGRAANVGDLRLGRGAGDQVRVSGSVWLDGNSKLFMGKRHEDKNEDLVAKEVQNTSNIQSILFYLTFICLHREHFMPLKMCTFSSET